MPHELDLILTLTGGLTAALVLGFASHRLGLSSIVGYLLAGILVGPFTPGFVADEASAQQFAEIGVVLLMFGVGLHFHVHDLWTVRKVAVPGALLQIAIATGLGVAVGRAGGWAPSTALVFGVALSVASTVVLTRVLSDADVLHTTTGHVAVGWLILEDVFTIVVLVLLPALAGPEAKGGWTGALLALGVALAKLGMLLGLAWLVGRRAIPAMLGFVARTHSRELFTLAVLATVLGIAVGSALLFGVSMALGAFVAGLIVGQSEFSSRAASDAIPMRDAFAVLFFVSVGMMLDLAAVADDWALILASLAVVLVGKPLAAIVVVLLLRRPLETAVSVGLALAQIGEFSFILAAFAGDIGVLPDAVSQVLVVTAIVSITLNPLLFRRRHAIAEWLRRFMPRARRRVAHVDHAHRDEERAVVVGFGPVGRTLTRLLRENHIEPVVVEMNLDTVRELERAGVRAVYGDASRPETLETAGIRSAGSLLVSALDATGDAIVRVAKELNPTIFVLGRTAYVGQGAAFLNAGADRVVAAEGEVALAMTEHLLERLGATAEQIDRERDRVRDELAPEPST